MPDGRGPAKNPPIATNRTPAHPKQIMTKKYRGRGIGRTSWRVYGLGLCLLACLSGCIIGYTSRREKLKKLLQGKGLLGENHPQHGLGLETPGRLVVGGAEHIRDHTGHHTSGLKEVIADQQAKQPGADQQDARKETAVDNRDGTKLSAAGQQDATKETAADNREGTKLSAAGQQDASKETAADNREGTKLSAAGQQDATKETAADNRDGTALSAAGQQDATKETGADNRDGTKRSAAGQQDATKETAADNRDGTGLSAAGQQDASKAATAQGDDTKQAVADEGDTSIAKAADQVGELNAYQHRLTTCSDLDWNKVNGRRERMKLQLKTYKFLDNYQNPCWKDPGDEGRGNDPKTRVHCLPYFYIIGQSKSGTTDLWNILQTHPNITAGEDKEYFWWNLGRIGLMNGLGGETRSNRGGQWLTFEQYVGSFDRATNKIAESGGTHFHPLVTGDASPSYLWNQDGWPAFPGNENMTQPKYLTADHIREVTPDAKFIILLRNPVDRLYSDYQFTQGLSQKRMTSPDDFHRQGVAAVRILSDCLATRETRECVYDSCLHATIPIRLHVGLYHIYLNDWLRVFHRKQFKIVRTEDYTTDRASSANEISKFLQIGSLPDHVMTEANQLPVLNKRGARQKESGPMLTETRTLLENFYRPFNEALAELLDDKRYLWQTSTKAVWSLDDFD